MWILLLSLIVGCGAPEVEAPRDPHAPERYRVLRGDTWSTIASKRTSSPEELRAWNGLSKDDMLVPGQILWIYRDGRKVAPVEPTTAVVAAPVAVDPTPQTDAPKKLPPPPIMPRPGMALLSLLDDLGPGAALEVGSSVRASAPGQADLSRRGDLGHSDAVVETVEITREIAAPSKPPTAGSAARLPKAEPKRCLPMKLEDPGEDGMVAAEGLGRDAIVAGMRPVVGAVGGCVDGGEGRWEVHLEVVVGCDGMVYDVGVLEDGGLGDGVAGCIAEVARQGSFAAAAAATTFIFPIHLAR